MPLRGKALRDRVVLRLIAIDRAFHFVVLVLLGIGVECSRRTSRACAAPTTGSSPTSSAGSPAVRCRSTGHVGILHELDRLFSLRSGTLRGVGAALLGYGLLEGIEAVGLWYTKRWAEYLTFVATTLLLPLEIYELTSRFSVLKVIGFIINVAVVIYLLYAKRLFGLRGGGAVDEEMRAHDVSWDAIEHATPPAMEPVALTLAEGEPAAPEREALESEIHRIGGEIAAAFPSSARHPVRALDARAMELASSDRELKAALFRFVDVVPACRSLDDLARHLRGFLDEVPDAPLPIAAAMRVSNTKAGRAALGAAAASGVKHMAHRFIIGETPARRARRAARPVGPRASRARVDLLGEATVTQAEADRYAERCNDALRAARRRGPQAGPSGRCSSTTAPARSRAPTSRSRSRR